MHVSSSSDIDLPWPQNIHPYDNTEILTFTGKPMAFHCLNIHLDYNFFHEVEFINGNVDSDVQTSTTINTEPQSMLELAAIKMNMVISLGNLLLVFLIIILICIFIRLT